MWLSTQRSSGSWRHPNGRGSLTFVFSSPAAKVEPPVDEPDGVVEVQHVDAGDLAVGVLEVGAEADDPARALRARDVVAVERDRVLARLDRQRPVAELEVLDARRGRRGGGEGEQRQHDGGEDPGEHAADSSGRSRDGVRCRSDEEGMDAAGGADGLDGRRQHCARPPGARDGVPGRVEGRGAEVPPREPAARSSASATRSARVRKIFKGRARARTKRIRLRALKKCRFRHIQSAVNAAKTNDRIQIMPGVYREEPSRRVPVDQAECAGDVRDARRRRREGRDLRAPGQVPERAQPDRGRSATRSRTPTASATRSATC